MPTWQHLLRSSKFNIRPDLLVSDFDTTRRISSKTASSHGIANGPAVLKPYTSSASTSKFLKMGWLRYVARTTNLLQLAPTQTATCPAGTSDGAEVRELVAPAVTLAFLRHRLSICWILTMCRILLHLDIFSRKVRERVGKREKVRERGA